MNKKLLHSPLFWCYSIMLIVVFILPFYSSPGYSIFTNTTSQLGAQNTPNAWIMNLVFFGLGISVIFEGLRKLKGYYFNKLLIIIFGASLFLTGIYSHAPINPLIEFNLFHDQLHSLFASVTGFSFTLFAISMSFIQKESKQKMLSIFMAVFATLLSILIFNVSEYAGIWQRGIFISAFLWLIYLFSNKKL